MTLLNVIGAISKNVSQLKYLLSDARWRILAQNSSSAVTWKIWVALMYVSTACFKIPPSPNSRLGHHEALASPSGTVEWAFVTDPILEITFRKLF